VVAVAGTLPFSGWVALARSTGMFIRPKKGVNADPKPDLLDICRFEEFGSVRYCKY